MTTNRNSRVFESNVKAVPLYGSETWQLTRGLKKKLHVLSNGALEIGGLDEYTMKSFQDKQGVAICKAGDKTKEFEFGLATCLGDKTGT